MKHLKSLLLGLLISTQAFAGLPPTTMKGQTDAGKTVTFNLQVPASQATRIDGTTALIETGNQNTLINPNAAGGTAGYTASGGTFTTGGTGNGTYFSWDSNSASQTVASGYQTIASGDDWSGNNGAVSARFKCDSGTCTHVLRVYDGTNVLASQTITSSTTQFVRTSVNFTYPASGTVRWEIASVASNEPTLYWRAGYRGLAEGFNLSQATGSVSTPWVSFTPTFTGYGTVSNVECQWRRDSGDLLERCKFTSGTPTAVEARVSFPSGLTSADTGSIPSIQMAGEWVFNQTTVDQAIVLVEPSVGYFTQGYKSSGNNGLSKATGSLMSSAGWVHSFKARVPIAGWAAQQNGLNFLSDQTAASWSGTATLAGTTTSTSFADPGSVTGSITQTSATNITCTAASSLVGFTCTLPRAGKYKACYAGYSSIAATPQNAQTKLADGSNNDLTGVQQGDVAYANAATPFGQCGVYTAAAAGSATFKVRAKVSANTGTFNLTTFSIEQTDSPGSVNFLGSVTSNSTGQTRLEHISFGGATMASACTGTCTIATSSGGQSVARTGTGAYTVTHTTAWTVKPTCTCGGDNAGTLTCSYDYANSSTTDLKFKNYNQTPTATDNANHIICMGPR